MRIWYRNAAREYIDGLPIGTGRLAAMILGDPREERMALNIVDEKGWEVTTREEGSDISFEIVGGETYVVTRQ